MIARAGMADKIVIMRNERVEHYRKPLDLYDRPSNQFVLTNAGIDLPLEGTSHPAGHAVAYGKAVGAPRHSRQRRAPDRHPDPHGRQCVERSCQSRWLG